jgi:hypothetical protein
MNLPGFTGEASLYKTSRHYYKAGNLTQTDGVYPALTITDRLRVPVVYYPWLELPVVHYPWTREHNPQLAAKLCCQKCRNDCNKKCPDRTCFDYCVKQCTSMCDVYEFGGCDRLLGL